MNFDGFAEDHFDPFAFFFYRDINNNSMLYVNDPTPGKSSRVFTLNSDNITITSTTDLIQIQKLSLTPQSDFNSTDSVVYGKLSSKIAPAPDFEVFCELYPEFENYTIFTEQGE